MCLYREANYLRRVVKVLLNAVLQFYCSSYRLASCFINCFSENLAYNVVASNSKGVYSVYSLGDIKEPVSSPLLLSLN